MSASSTETKVISRETIHRLLADVKYIYNNPLTDNGIFYTHDDADIMKGYALIVGPEETPYFGGFYFFELDFVYCEEFIYVEILHIFYHNHVIIFLFYIR